MDSRRARDSKVLEEVGVYDPMIRDEERQADLKTDRIQYWLGVGAQPSDTVRRLLERRGVLGEGN